MKKTTTKPPAQTVIDQEFWMCPVNAGGDMMAIRIENASMFNEIHTFGKIRFRFNVVNGALSLIDADVIE